MESSWFESRRKFGITFFHDELSGVLAQEVVEGNQDHGVGVHGLLADAPLQTVPMGRRAISLSFA